MGGLGGWVHLIFINAQRCDLIRFCPVIIFTRKWNLSFQPEKKSLSPALTLVASNFSYSETRLNQQCYNLSIDNWVPHSGMLLYLHHRNSKLFFHPAKFDNFKDEKISDFKTVSVSQSKNCLHKCNFLSESLMRLKEIFQIFCSG